MSIERTDYSLLRSPRQEIKGICPPAVYGKRRYIIVKQFSIIWIVNRWSRPKASVSKAIAPK